MAKITHADMLKNRKCGLKYYDNAVNLVGHQRLIDMAIDNVNLYPDMWGPGWATFKWGFANAVHEALNVKGDISQTYNLRDVLIETDIAYIQSKLPSMVGFPPDIYPRK